ncbi:MAG: phosphotransferase [Clostridia bacterium]|nr:phosphotransferase [Clostridia bacterium]
MFKATEKDIRRVLHDYGIQVKSFTFEELERYHYEKDDPESRQVRLIAKVNLQNGRSLVLRFKNEDDAPQEIMEAQSRFAALLHSRGIETPKAYTSEGFYARHYLIDGYDVIATVEDFEDGEIKTVDPITARETGELLARMHNIAEEADAHVQSEVLFDPLAPNDLFDFDAFVKCEEKLLAIDSELYHAIVQKNEWLVSQIRPFGNELRYAVQGDISDCNLYRTQNGRLGVFDFNRCGDNNLFFDAVMQAVFEARLMDYPEELAGRQEEVILSSFLKGYHQVRPFSEEQKAVFPYLHALISAFWWGDMKWDEDSLTKAIESGDCSAAHEWMERIYQHELYLLPMPV